MDKHVFRFVKFGAVILVVAFVAMVVTSVSNVIGYFTKDWIPTLNAVAAYCVTGYVMYLWSRIVVDFVKKFADAKQKNESLEFKGPARDFSIVVGFFDLLVVGFGVMFVAIDYVMNKFNLFESIDERVRTILFGSIWVLYVALIIATFVTAYAYRQLFPKKEMTTAHQIAELLAAFLCVVGNAFGTYHAVVPLAGEAIALGMAILNDFMIFVMIGYAMFANDTKTKDLAFKAAWVFIGVTSVIQILGGYVYASKVDTAQIENWAWFSFPLMMLVSVVLVVWVLFTDYVNGGLSFVGPKTPMPEQMKQSSVPQYRVMGAEGERVADTGLSPDQKAALRGLGYPPEVIVRMSAREAQGRIDAKARYQVRPNAWRPSRHK